MTKYGVCCPPAPTDCIAFHNPGAVKAAIPTMVAWKNTPRNQLYGLRLPSCSNSEDGEDVVASAEGGLIPSDIVVRLESVAGIRRTEDQNSEKDINKTNFSMGSSLNSF
jgi:hypothetical protein